MVVNKALGILATYSKRKSNVLTSFNWVKNQKPIQVIQPYIITTLPK